jgi:transcription-repair coupling factor (superfamily II helicase)
MQGKRFFGLQGGATGWFIGRALPTHPKIVLFCPTKNAQEQLIGDLKFFCGSTPILAIAGSDTLPFEEVSPDIDLSAQRIHALLSLKVLPSYVAVLSPEALPERTLDEELLGKLCFSLAIHQTIDKAVLIQRLLQAGYSGTPAVSQVGDFTIRGSVIDCFTSSHTQPLRFEFEDQRIVSIRLFDIDTQRSISEIPTVTIYPVRELSLFSKESLHHAQLEDVLDRIKLRGKKLETPPREIARWMHALRSGTLLPGYELIQKIATPVTTSVFDFIPQDALTIVQDSIGIMQMVDEESDQIEARYERLTNDHHLIPEQAVTFLSRDDIHRYFKRKDHVHLDHLSSTEDTDDVVNLLTRSTLDLATKIKAARTLEAGEATLHTELDNLRRRGTLIAFCVGAEARAKRLQALLTRIGIEAPIAYYSAQAWLDHPHKPPVVILSGSLSGGFFIPDPAAVFIAEHEIFAERSQRKKAHATFNLKRILATLAKLTEGDYVVHSDYGIGRYNGLKHFDVEGGAGDFLHIQYADSVLYVPIQNIGRVKKFSASEGQVPQLDKLASTRWVKTKAKIRESVAALAGDLIRLYAARSVAKGWRFEPWGAEDERFAEGFPYNETPDQQRAIEEVIADMSKDQVMDRLVCGDVGFGKTEVAIRAAFKAIQHKRQVAVLVPTTILVEQHRKNFAQRFQGYDVTIKALSRFNAPKDTKCIIEEIKTGDVDIIIGTHRLLSKDILFNDLGLVIIDEEHRFGVKQKEKLKALKRSVDVLTLTATPIPRTLHMSLLSIRDISVIQSPPLDRRSIRTYVANHDATLIRDAIIRELQRGGQAFYLHNRVQSIDAVTATLRELIPEARIRYAHGQMTETQLEGIMQDFIDHKFDLLVSTTIIESGIDIPNANTLIVERADTFGLAQLYQIRGRVGRSTRQAYAYLLVPKMQKLNEDARRRLKALQSLDELGHGFNLAMQDLEIRGAGNLLGKEQSGSVLAVGFDLYTKILREAVLNLKGEELDLSESIDPEIKIPAAAFIPSWYIPDVSERLIMYQRLAGIETATDAQEFRSEMVDRFGPIPPEVHAFIELMRLRALLRVYGVPKLELINNGLVISLSKRSPVQLEKILSLTKQHPHTFRFGKNLSLNMRLEHPDRIQPDDLYPLIAELFERIS